MGAGPVPTDRRPLASRDLGVMKALASWLAHRRVSPNGISVLGMIAGVVAGVLFALTAHTADDWGVRGLFIGAAACIQLRLLCNLIDGMVAVEGGMRSVVGDLYNEVPDRVSDIGTLVGAGYAVTAWPAAGYWAAVLAVLTAYIRAMGKALVGVNDYRGPMAKQQRMAVMTVAAAYLALAPAAWRPVVEVGGRAYGLLAMALAVVALGAAVTCVRRLGAIAAELRRRAA